LAREWPNEPDVLYNLALLDLESGDYATACGLLAQLVIVDPNHADGWYYLAACDVRNGQFDAAVEKLQRSVTLDPSLDSAWRTDGRFEAFRRAGSSL